MGVRFGVLRVSTLLLVGLAGQASQSQARGSDEDPTYAVVCGRCKDVVGESRTYPTGVDEDCGCGATRPGADWKSTTLVLTGVPCPTCNAHLYYEDRRGIGDCKRGGGHVPAPLHERAWR